MAGVGLAIGLSLAVPANARPSDPGVVNYAVLGKGSVGNIVGATMRFEWSFTDPFQSYYVDIPVCNNWADIGLPEVYADPDLAAFNGAVAQESPTDMTHFVKQAVGVFATSDAAGRAFHRVVDRTVGCRGQTTAMHLDNLDQAGLDVCWRAGECYRRGLGQAGGRHRPSLLQPRPGNGKMFCYRRKSANTVTAVPRSTCWQVPCRTPSGIVARGIAYTSSPRHWKIRGILSVSSGRWCEGRDRSLPGRGRKI